MFGFARNESALTASQFITRGMDLLNRTQFSAAFLNTIVAEDRLLGAVVLKAAFRVTEGKLIPDPARPWPAGGEPIKTEFGEVEGETPFLRDGADLIVLGKAYPSEGSSTGVTVSIRAETIQYDIQVVGDRKWIRGNDGNLVPSPPLPFNSMPLTWDRAFGGKAKVEAGDLPFAANPHGRGFYMDAVQAENRPLPNLEDPANPVRTWKDQPQPRAPGPYGKEGAMRAHRSAEFDTTGPVPKLVRLKPAYFNNANPQLILKPLPPAGSTVTISNVRPGGRGCRFVLPDLAFHVYVQLKDRPYVFPVHLESIIILAEEERVVLGYRSVFRYRMVPLERRIAVIQTGPVPPNPPANYFIRWEELEPQKGANA
jgi:hypothetical protein